MFDELRVEQDDLTKAGSASQRPPYRLAVCLPVWNRRDLFQASFTSLLRQLGGIEASIWIFDNGSDAETQRYIGSLSCEDHRLFKIFLPQNMGIPFVVNIFSQMVTQDCEFAGYRAPVHVMVADADAYFKKPVQDMIEILEGNSHFAVISGHDSIEHESIAEVPFTFRDQTIIFRVKTIERGLCLIMRREILAACVPFPHHRDRDVDWELMKWHPNSIAARTRQLAVVDYVAHIGLYDSTWHPFGAPSNAAEIAEVNRILEQEGLFSPERVARMERYCELTNSQAAMRAQAAITI
jgi:Glycosyl transferase family 2